MGHGQVVDSMINDGLWCTFEDWHMGNAGEVVAADYGITRQRAGRVRDRAAIARRPTATAAGRFGAEIVPVDLPQKKGDPIVVRSRRIDPRRHIDGRARRDSSRRSRRTAL